MDYNVVLINNLGQGEAVTENEDGSYTIFIEARLDIFQRRAKFLHAVKHINEMDFCKFNVNDIEYGAHGYGNPNDKI